MQLYVFFFWGGVMLQERLLKPLSGFSGISGEMRELAAIISEVQTHSHRVKIIHTVSDIYTDSTNIYRNAPLSIWFTHIL